MHSHRPRSYTATVQTYICFKHPHHQAWTPISLAVETMHSSSFDHPQSHSSDHTQPMHSTAWTWRSLAQSSTAQLGPCTVEHKPSLGCEQLSTAQLGPCTVKHSQAQSGHSHAQSSTVRAQPCTVKAQSCTVKHSQEQSCTAQHGPCTVKHSSARTLLSHAQPQLGPGKAMESSGRTKGQ